MFIKNISLIFLGLLANQVICSTVGDSVGDLAKREPLPEVKDVFDVEDFGDEDFEDEGDETLQKRGFFHHPFPMTTTTSITPTPTVVPGLFVSPLEVQGLGCLRRCLRQSCRRFRFNHNNNRRCLLQRVRCVRSCNSRFFV